MIFEVVIEVSSCGEIVVLEIMIFLVSVMCEVELVKVWIEVVVVVVCVEMGVEF